MFSIIVIVKVLIFRVFIDLVAFWKWEDDHGSVVEASVYDAVVGSNGGDGGVGIGKKLETFHLRIVKVIIVLSSVSELDVIVSRMGEGVIGGVEEGVGEGVGKG